MRANELVDVAGEYARERGIPPETIMKEILHYEILQAMIDSDVAEGLTFKGGTCLRLCHQGTRYSEDLDFAGGPDYEPRNIQPFFDLLRGRVAQAYALTVEVTSKHSQGEHIAMNRHAIRIGIPQMNPSLPQKQVINLEIAAVAAHEPTMAHVAAHYPHLPPATRTMFVQAETQDEILADKIIAIGARPYVKQRDIWDLKMLADRNTPVRLDLVQKKFSDYSIDPQRFVDSLAVRANELKSHGAAERFHREISRFVDGRMARALGDQRMARLFIEPAIRLVERVAVDMGSSIPDVGSAPFEQGPGP